ncbi:MAG: beta-N-acetylhexosaminidase [Deltaproteobacteria bacterium]|nr:beta-N-acetylhexosaminidase [Candidatus Anaeroferrophillacea bacterium]
MLKVGTCLIMGVEGPELTAAEHEVWASDPPAGVILFARNCPSRAAVTELLAALRETGRYDAGAAGRPLVVAVDQEFGPVNRLREFSPPFPGAAELGAAADVHHTAAAAAAVGHWLAELGVNLNLAPVADLGAPGSTVLGGRCFGADPRSVARHVAAYVRGLQGAGVAAAAKHFPGHGAVIADSHRELPVSPLVLPSLMSRHLAPFAAAIAAGVRTVMAAHILFPRVDPNHPASCSAVFIEHVLRRRLGFDGAVLTDDVDMAALSGSPAARMSRCLAAGCDGLIWGRNLGPVRDPRPVFDEMRRRLGAADAGLDQRLAPAHGRIRGLCRWLSRGRESCKSK